MIIFSCFMIIGYAMFLGSSPPPPSLSLRQTFLLIAFAYTGSAKKHVDYGSLFFQVVGVYTAAPTISAWVANSFQPHFKRGTAIAWAYVMTNCGGTPLSLLPPLP